MTALKKLFAVVLDTLVRDNTYDEMYVSGWSHHRVRLAEDYTQTLYEGLLASSAGQARPIDAATREVISSQRREALIATLKRDDDAIASREARIAKKNRANFRVVSRRAQH